MAEVRAMQRDVRQMPWVRVQLLGSSGNENTAEWIPFESDRLAPSGKRAGVMMHPCVLMIPTCVMDAKRRRRAVRGVAWGLQGWACSGRCRHAWYTSHSCCGGANKLGRRRRTIGTRPDAWWTH
jgi:hypothetical protein